MMMPSKYCCRAIAWSPRTGETERIRDGCKLLGDGPRSPVRDCGPRQSVRRQWRDAARKDNWPSERGRDVSSRCTSDLMETRRGRRDAFFEHEIALGRRSSHPRGYSDLLPLV